jgi:hypothetical protein
MGEAIEWLTGSGYTKRVHSPNGAVRYVVTETGRDYLQKFNASWRLAKRVSRPN